MAYTVHRRKLLKPKEIGIAAFDMAGVEYQPSRSHCRCHTCSTEWELLNPITMQQKRRIPDRFWQCPQGCNSNAV